MTGTPLSHRARPASPDLVGVGLRGAIVPGGCDCDRRPLDDPQNFSRGVSARQHSCQHDERGDIRAGCSPPTATCGPTFVPRGPTLRNPDHRACALVGGVSNDADTGVVEPVDQAVLAGSAQGSAPSGRRGRRRSGTDDVVVLDAAGTMPAAPPGAPAGRQPTGPAMTGSRAGTRCRGQGGATPGNGGERRGTGHGSSYERPCAPPCCTASELVAARDAGRTLTASAGRAGPCARHRVVVDLAEDVRSEGRRSSSWR